MLGDVATGEANTDDETTVNQVAITDALVADTVLKTNAGEVTITVIFTALDASSSTGSILGEDDVVAETALFDADGGNLLARVALSSTTVVEGDTVTITWTITATDNTP